MSKQSQTEMAVLGALELGPATGYAIRQEISETLGQFWSESYGQIYPTLSRLVRDGLATPDAPGRTSGTSFRITAAGALRLRELLREPAPVTPARNGRLLRLFFGSLLGPRECMAIVEDAEAAAQSLLAHLAHARAEVEHETDPGAAYRLITISAGEHAARAQLAWARESVTTLRGLAEAEEDR